jgi:hypothetical protein
MQVYLHARITVNAAERHAMHCAILGATECGSASAAEAQAPSWCGLILCKIVRT